jgi:hypothetical protein
MKKLFTKAAHRQTGDIYARNCLAQTSEQELQRGHGADKRTLVAVTRPTPCCQKPLLPDDAKLCAGRSVDDVVANQCLIDTMGFVEG